jgi:excisionase family DNA binding protein
MWSTDKSVTFRMKTAMNQRLELLTEEIKKLPPEKIEQLERLVRSLGKRALSLKEAAQMLNVSPDTVRRGIKSGSIKAFRLNKSGDYRISIEELDQFMKGGKPV